MSTPTFIYDSQAEPGCDREGGECYIPLKGARSQANLRYFGLWTEENDKEAYIPLGPRRPGRHSRSELFLRRDWVLIMGKDGRSFCRVPVDARSWSQVPGAEFALTPEGDRDLRATGT